jgi:hypothetical protein
MKASKLAYRIWVILIANERVKKKKKKERKKDRENIYSVLLCNDAVSVFDYRMVQKSTNRRLEGRLERLEGALHMVLIKFI